jgi:glycerate kinase
MTRRGRTVIVAPTAFKGTLGPAEVAEAMAAGVSRCWPKAEMWRRPLSDGGNGLLEACRALEGGELEPVEVQGPLGVPVRARTLRQGSRAVIESAEACGLHLVPESRRDPTSATTFGVGELIRAAVSEGVESILIGLGGSATVDGGTGMARALGWSFLDDAGRSLPPGGGALNRLAALTPPAKRPQPLDVTALCDVENALVGPLGAARVYGPQKGATPEQVEILEAGLARLAAVVEADLGVAVADEPGAGAAGGLGAGCRAFLGARLVSGADWMMERAGLAKLLASADLVVTGEGHFDAQSRMGKATGRVLAAAAAAGVPALLVCGRIDGALPEGVEAREAADLGGGGRELVAEEVAELTAAGCRALEERRTL